MVTSEEAVQRLSIVTTSEGTKEATRDLQDLTKAGDGVTVALQSQERASISAESKFAQLERRYVSSVRAQQDFERVQRLVNAAVAQNPELQGRANVLLEATRARMLALTEATNQAAGAHGGFSTQAMSLQHAFRSMIEGFASGAPVTQVLGQQFSHLSYAATGEGGLTGAFGQVASKLSFLLNPVALVGTAIVALGAGIGYAASSFKDGQDKIEVALQGIGRQSGATASDINRIAESAGSATTYSVAQAREMAAAIAATGKVNVANIGALIGITRDYAAVTGQDAVASQKELAAAMADPAKGALELNQKLGFLNGTTLQYIETLAAAGDKTRAQAVLIEMLGAAAAGAADKVEGFWTRFWNAQKAGASQDFSNIGKFFSGPSDQERLPQLMQRRDVAAASNALNPTALGTEYVKQLNDEIDKLNAKLRQEAVLVEAARLDKLGLQAQSTVKSIFGEIGAIESLTGKLNELKQAQSNSAISQRQGSSAGYNDAAIQAMELEKQKQEELLNTTIRHNEVVQQLAQSYLGVSQATAEVLARQQDQLAVAQAVTGQQRLAAQEQANYNQLIQQGVSQEEASAIAAGQRQIAEAQIDSQYQNQIKSLQQQAELIRARVAGTEDAVRAQQAYQNALDAGASPQTAAQAANAQRELTQAQKEANDEATRAQAAAAERAKEQAAATQAAAEAQRKNAEEARKAAEEAAKEAAIRAAFKFIPFIVGGEKLYQTPGGGLSQFDPNGYKSTEQSPAESYGNYAYGRGGYSVPGQVPIPNDQGLTYELTQLYNNTLNSGGSIQDAINKAFQMNQGYITQNTSDFITRLNNLLPKDQQAGNLELEIAKLQTQPETLARDELIKSLTDSLDQLKQSTDANTQAKLDPLMSQGHQYLDQLKIGYYKAATGLTGVVGGTGATDSQRFVMDLTPGELVQVTPPGQWGGSTTSNVSNDNSRVVNQTVHFHLGPVSSSRDLLTARQRAQGFLQAARMAAG